MFRGHRNIRVPHALVSESGQVLWNGTKVVGQAEGVLAVRDLVDAVAFDVQKHLAAFLAKPL